MLPRKGPPYVHCGRAWGIEQGAIPDGLNAASTRAATLESAPVARRAFAASKGIRPCDEEDEQSSYSNIDDCHSNTLQAHSIARSNKDRLPRDPCERRTTGGKHGEKMRGKAVDKKSAFATLFLFHLTPRCCKRVLTKFAAHHAAGFVGLRSRCRRCGRAGRRGRSNPPLIPPARATSGAWHVTPGTARWSKRRRHSLLQSVGALRGQPGAAWHERPPVPNLRE